MDPISQQAFVAAGAAASDATYVDDVFSTYVYEGTGGTQSINNGIDLSGEGGLVWIKNRSADSSHRLLDTERGAGKVIYSSTNAQETTETNTLTSFNSNGFTTGGYLGSYDFASWTFRKAPGFFDVVTYTGNGTSGRTISHNLGSVPGMIIVKALNTTGYSWTVWHRSLPSGKVLYLNFTSEQTDQTDFPSAPTSTNFTLGDSGSVNSQYGFNYVAYVFAHDDQSFGTNSDEAIIKCGSYTGNDSTNGPEIDLGFEPQFVITKSSTAAYNWFMADNMRGVPTSGTTHYLNPNSGSDETATANEIDFTPTGFKLKSGNAQTNNPATYVYMAIRRPHKPPEAGTDVFAIDTSDATSPSPPQFTSGFVTDVVIRKTMNGANNTMGSRLQGIYYMQPSSNTQEDRVYPATALTWDFMDGWSNSSGVNTNLFAYMFKRAPGFMDVVAYKGTGSARTLNHNLGAVPELVIVKNRENGSYGWSVYASYLSSPRDKAMYLNDTMAAQTNNAGTFWGNTDFTATQISLGSYANTNHNGIDMIAYLFASLDGISKVGTYSGTGYNIDVDCGFTAGARFVMIKRTDTEISGTTGTHWYIWDTTNGIVSGNDPYWKVSDAAASVTNTDYIDPLNAGFTVTSSAPAALNASGGTYLFLAIA